MANIIRFIQKNGMRVVVEGKREVRLGERRRGVGALNNGARREGEERGPIAMRDGGGISSDRAVSGSVRGGIKKVLGTGVAAKPLIVKRREELRAREEEKREKEVKIEEKGRETSAVVLEKEGEVDGLTGLLMITETSEIGEEGREERGEEEKKGSNEIKEGLERAKEEADAEVGKKEIKEKEQTVKSKRAKRGRKRKAKRAEAEELFEAEGNTGDGEASVGVGSEEV